MKSIVSGVGIIGISAAVSSKWDRIEDLSKDDAAIIERFKHKTGVQGRHSASINQTSADFCYAAAEAIINRKMIARNDIGVLVFVTQSPDYRMPATAYVLQHRLSLSEDCIVFDVNLGCSGYVYGLSIVSTILQTTNARYGLLLAGDTAAREFSKNKIEKTGHTAGLLFGDAGSATLLENHIDSEMVYLLNADGSGFRNIIAPYAGWRNPDGPNGRGSVSQMDDIGVFNFATNKAPEQINHYMQITGTSPDHYDCLVLHQANMMIMKRIAKKTGFAPEKMLISMDRFGNTSSASIPLTLVDTYGQNNGKNRINAMCCGFGVGLSWGTTCVSVQSEDIIPLVYTDEYYSDGFQN